MHHGGLGCHGTITEAPQALKRFHKIYDGDTQMNQEEEDAKLVSLGITNTKVIADNLIGMIERDRKRSANSDTQFLHNVYIGRKANAIGNSEREGTQR